jgi:hypothetical protein
VSCPIVKESNTTLLKHDTQHDTSRVTYYILTIPCHLCRVQPWWHDFENTTNGLANMSPCLVTSRYYIRPYYRQILIVDTVLTIEGLMFIELQNGPNC